MNKKYRKIYSILLATILCFTLSNPLSTHAKESAATPYAYDTVSKSYTRTFGKTLTCQSISPSYVTSDMLNSSQKSVTFNIQLTGAIQYDRISSSYVSASSPTATLNYVGPVNLGLYNVTTGAVDGGSYITFTCSADVKGIVEVSGLITTIDYGRIYCSFKQPK